MHFQKSVLLKKCFSIIQCHHIRAYNAA